jgi:hypothetical protein
MASHLMDCAASMKLPASKKLVLMAFADSGDKFTRRALPGFETVLEWSGLARSRAMEVISELIEDGLLVRVAAATVGKRAEFVVFPKGCCVLHGEVPADAVPPASATARTSTRPGSGPADPGTQPGSGSGSGSGSGPDRTPSNLRISTTPSLPPTSGESPPTQLALVPEPDGDPPPKQTRRKKPARPVPDDWTLTPELRAWAVAEVPGLDIDTETKKWLDHHRAVDSQFREWGSAWKKWMRTAHQDLERRNRSRPQRSGPYTDDRWTSGEAAREWGEWGTT